MQLCKFCKQLNDRKSHVYCKKCNNLYLEQQNCLPKELRNNDSDIVPVRKFRICKKCNKSLILPRSKSCQLCETFARKDYFIKRSLRNVTNLFLRKSYITKAKNCELCQEKKIEAHHDDYNKPSKIRWLCKSHHTQHHVEDGKYLNT